jgi:Uma2 family endonuclease
MPAADRRYVTEDEFYALLADVERVELFDGEVVVSPAVTPRHQKVLRRLATAVQDWAAAQVPPWEALFAPLDVRFARDRILQPDLMLFDRVFPESEPRPIRVVPRLLAEVLSPSTEDYDRYGKRLAYAEADVPAYLLVDTDAEVIEVFSGPGLRQRALCRDRLLVPGFVGLDVDLDAVFARER